MIRTLSLSQKAKVQLTNNRLVRLDGTNGVEYVTAAGQLALGVVEHGADAGRQVTVHVQGVVEIEAGANITAGIRVTGGADGKLAVYTPTDTSTVAPGTTPHAKPIGLALSGGATGKLVEVLLVPNLAN